MEDKTPVDPLRLISWCFTLAAFCGLGALLKSNDNIGWRTVLAAIICSGCLGTLTGLTLIALDYNVFIVLAVAGFAGFGQVTIISIILRALKRGGINITIGLPKNGDDE